jgi:SAM-dependent methyltransferase
MLRLVKQEYDKVGRANFLRYKDYIHPELDDDAFLGWFRRYGYSFSSVPEWIGMLNGFDVVVGTRIHGVMAGIQAGVPSLCMCIDSRTLVLCRTMSIPHVDANDYKDGITADQIADLLRQWEWRSYDETRRVLAGRMVRFLMDNGLEPKNSLPAILNGRSKVAAAYQAKPGNTDVHQVSTASFDDRYRSVFRAMERTLDTPTPKLLSFGCSDGFETNDLAAKHFHHARVVGCDIDDDALRIARLHNRYPSRVEIIQSERDELLAFAPFDGITAMAVLCRWPDTREMDDISGLYPFSKFEESIEYLVSLLRLGGILCVYNANYLVSETGSFAQLEAIELAELIPKTQPVRLFGKNGRPLVKQEVRGVLFRKRIPS